MKIGIFGGTFNPPHNGHLRLIETFADKLELDKVLVIPDKRPVHKICEDLALDSDRAELCRRTFTGKNYEVSTMEIDRHRQLYDIHGERDFEQIQGRAAVFDNRLGYVFVVS